MHLYLDVKNLYARSLTNMANRNQDTRGVHVWLVLMKAYQALNRKAMPSIANTGLCFSDFAVLEILLHKGPLPVNALGAKVSLTSGSATAAIDRLAGKGLVRRADDPEDRRARIVHLTPKGKNLIEAAFRIHEHDMEAAVSALSPAERQTLITLLKRVGKSAEATTSTHGASHAKNS